MKSIRLNFDQEDADIVAFLKKVPRPYRCESFKIAYRKHIETIAALHGADPTVETKAVTETAPSKKEAPELFI